VSIDTDPSAAFASFITGRYDFGPEYGQVVRRSDLEVALQKIPRLQTKDYIVVFGGITWMKLDQEPFKDVRVRRALYQAIDIQTLQRKLMRGQSVPTGAVMPSPLGVYGDPELERRLPYDVAGAKRAIADAGYPNGFEVTLDCPNNRYINDEAICVALTAMWAQINVRVKVNAMPRALYFPKLQRLDTSMYLLGWGGSITDAETIFTPIYRSRGEGGVGSWNFGNARDAQVDELAAASSREADPAKREQLVKATVRRFNDQVLAIPLHRQVVPWAARSDVSVVHRADNWLEWRWVSVGKR
jgi:peptide/nickel transport system substrate-binding protein